MWQDNQFLSLFQWLYIHSHSHGHNAFCVLVPIIRGEMAKGAETGTIWVIRGEKSYLRKGRECVREVLLH